LSLSKPPATEVVRALREFGGHLRDVYLCGAGFDWTFVMTHEDQYGPYFAVGTASALQE
jgi:hypothetical protein